LMAELAMADPTSGALPHTDVNVWGTESRRWLDSTCTRDTLRSLTTCTGTTLDSLPTSTFATLDDLPSLDDEAGQLQNIAQHEALSHREFGELASVAGQPEKELFGYQEECQNWGIHAMHEHGYDVREHLDAGSPAATGELGLPRGTFCFMRRAVRLQDKTDVLVKCLSSNQQLDGQKRQDLLHEYILLRSLQHSAIISAEGLLETRFDSWLVMDNCTCSVQACVESVGAFSERRARHLLLQMLRGLRHMHRRKVVHRDLQPANLLLTDRPFTLKIANFANAGRLQASSSNDSAGLRMDGQARQYLAPELLLRQLWDERVDTWAAGLTFYFKVRSRLPFDVKNMQVLSALSAGTLPAGAEWHGLSDDAKELINQCLTVDPCSRPTVDELLQRQMQKDRDCKA